MSAHQYATQVSTTSNVDASDVGNCRERTANRSIFLKYGPICRSGMKFIPKFERDSFSGKRPLPDENKQDKTLTDN